MIKRWNRALLAGVAGAAALAICGSASADVVIASWENLVVPPPPDPNPLPPFYHRPIGSAGIEGTHDFHNRSVYVNDTYGATNGTKSLKAQINPTDTGSRFTFNLSLELPEAGAVGTMLSSGLFAIDVSWRNSDWVHSAGQNGYAGINQCVVNASGVGVGFLDGGKATHDTFREARIPEPDSFKGFWDKSFGDETTTLTWDMTVLVNGSTGDNEVTAVQAPEGGGFVNIVLSTVYDDAFDHNTAAFYFDNARFLPRVVASEWTGQAPDPDDNPDNGNAASGLWHASMNWTHGVPGFADSVATFGTNGGALSGPQVVNTEQSTTVAALNFDNPAGYTIGGAGSITLDVSTGSASITVGSGSHTIQVPVVAMDDTTITSNAGSGVALTGDLTATGKTITKAGAGSVQFQNVRAGALNVLAGSARISANGSANDPAGTTVVQSLSINAGASLDLTNNSMIIDYTGPVGTLVNDVRQHMASGRLTSSSATPLRGLGYGDNAVLGKSIFAGQIVDTSAVLVKFTYFGDSDLDGDVDVADLGSLASAWQTSGTWINGDFDYNGSVDVNDLGLLASNWQAGVGNPLGPSLQESLISLGLPNVTVPEPAAVGWVIAVALKCHRRRRL
jgi:hypothetical protein